VGLVHWSGTAVRCTSTTRCTGAIVVLLHDLMRPLSQDRKLLILVLNPLTMQGAGGYSLPEIRRLLQDNFSPWGAVKSLYIKHGSTMCFVT
jgi:hypothetical protein